ncbi:MAG: putative zinc-binding metallopeptidase [Pseudomonadota bacterium]
MKRFICHCANVLDFENSTCVQCKRSLGFLPDLLELAALEPAGGDDWLALHPAAEGRRYRRCRQSTAHQVCNWMVLADDPEPYCLACRLNEVIPNLDTPGNRALWLSIERRKHRLVYDLRRHRLPVYSRSEDPDHGLGFAFLESDAEPMAGDRRAFNDYLQPRPVLTGHQDGLITINIAEADDVERERRRVQLNEPQRTLLGHFRHESGHYYWDRLVGDGPLLDRVRSVFGDERADYAQALERYYSAGPVPHWSTHWISAYASVHPWEDWAECWAHWLKISDALETAAGIGMVPAESLHDTFDQRIAHWIELALDFNQLCRSLDQPDAYPFVLTPPVVEKLRLVDEVIQLSGHT